MGRRGHPRVLIPDRFSHDAPIARSLVGMLSLVFSRERSMKAKTRQDGVRLTSNKDYETIPKGRSTAGGAQTKEGESESSVADNTGRPVREMRPPPQTPSLHSHPSTVLGRLSDRPSYPAQPSLGWSNLTFRSFTHPCHRNDIHPCPHTWDSNVWEMF